MRITVLELTFSGTGKTEARERGREEEEAVPKRKILNGGCWLILSAKKPVVFELSQSVTALEV